MVAVALVLLAKVQSLKTKAYRDSRGPGRDGVQLLLDKLNAYIARNRSRGRLRDEHGAGRLKRMKNLQTQVEESVDEFWGKLQVVVLDAAETVWSQRREGKQKAAIKKCRARDSAATPAAKRSTDELLQLSQKLHAQICHRPGETMAVYGAQLGMPSPALSVPIRKLLDAQKVGKTGKRSETRYFPIGPAAP